MESEYRREWYQKVLLVKKDPEILDDMQIQLTTESPSYIPNQQVFVNSLVKEYREFILLEIISENLVIEHLRFIHPSYIGTQ